VESDRWQHPHGLEEEKYQMFKYSYQSMTGSKYLNTFVRKGGLLLAIIIFKRISVAQSQKIVNLTAY